MKTKIVIRWLNLAAAIIAFTACEKKQDSTKPGAETNKALSDIGDSLKDAATTAANEAKKVGADVKATAEKVVTDVVHQAESVVASTTSMAQDYLDKAKSLVNEQKYQEALSSLKELANFKLTPEQQKAFDDLKKTIQTALGTKAATNGISTVQGLLNK